MTLKEIIFADNDEVFLNLEELAEYVEIDGVLIKCQVQYHTERRSGVTAENHEGIYGDWVKVFFETKDYVGKNGRLPVEGEFLKVGSKLYKVLSSKDEMGITRLQLAGYRQEQVRIV